ncbi:histidine utilization repressor (plasmid) [Salipiger sp. H15]|uniref:Histidine utilization repressor n=1 Tax=Alloyangia sp. H15 TaxID=3029062 RepID=A0AAU8ASS7_9RHOB
MPGKSAAEQEFRRFSQGVPLYEAVKLYLEAQIRTGVLAPNDRIPSENEIVAGLGVSRMTANRALRELAAEGKITRIHGVGSFVSEPKPSSAMLDVRNIAEEIRERGHRHDMRVALLERIAAPARLREAFGLGAEAELFHSVIVHSENGTPIQIENRYVNPAVAPDYLAQDFRTETPNAYLTRCAAITNIDVIVEAVLPDEDEAEMLQISRGDPCLLLQRRTWNNDRVVTQVYALHPGPRYRLSGSAR